jgi:uncharacterized LabA/DUF88 family protein
MANVYVYVDGFNLFYGALKRTPYRWLDVGRLCRMMLPHDSILAIRYFTARVSARPGDPQKPIRQEMFLRALRTIPNLSIHFGQFRTRPKQLPLSNTTPPKFVWVDRTEEKGSDVNLAAHLLLDGFHKRYETAVLVTNDSDLETPVRMVRKDLVLQIGILNPHPTNSSVLKQWANFTKRIRQSDIAAAQFPAILTGFLQSSLMERELFQSRHPGKSKTPGLRSWASAASPKRSLAFIT